MRVVVCLLFASLLWGQQESLLPTVEQLRSRLELADRDNIMRAAILRDLFEKEGCTGENLIEQPVRKKGAPNVICILPGEGPSTIIVGAHSDAIGGSGVADNWSGAAALPLIYRGVKTVSRKHTIVFVGFADEEIGLVGSRQYVSLMSPSDRKLVKAMVNLDTLSLGLPKVWISRSSRVLTDMYALIANRLNVQLAGANYDNFAASDSESFKPLKIPSIDITTIAPKDLDSLHTKKDNSSLVRLEDYGKTCEFLQVYVAFVARTLE